MLMMTASRLNDSDLTTELMDNVVINAVENAFHLNLPTDAGALLLIDVDGPPETEIGRAHV